MFLASLNQSTPLSALSKANPHQTRCPDLFAYGVFCPWKACCAKTPTSCLAAQRIKICRQDLNRLLTRSATQRSGRRWRPKQLVRPISSGQINLQFGVVLLIYNAHAQLTMWMETTATELQLGQLPSAEADWVWPTPFQINILVSLTVVAKNGLCTDIAVAVSMRVFAIRLRLMLNVHCIYN